MAIATRKPTTDFVPTPTLPIAYSENYKGLMYDNNHVPLVSLISYMDGSPWMVESYYRQSLGAHNDLKELDTTLSAEFQSYERIDRLELLIETDLQSSSNNIQQTTAADGSALIYPFFIPNVNDYFVAITGYRNRGLFRVKTVDRRTFRTDSVHSITFDMVGYLDDLPKEEADLKAKTVREYVFSRERLMEGLAPILKTEVFESIGNLRYEYERIGTYYLENFLDRGTKTLTWPGQTSNRIYDPFLVSFVMSTFSYNTFDKMLGVKELNKSGDEYLDEPQFWRCVLNRRYDDVKWGNMTMQFVRTGQFSPNSWIKSLAFARMDYIVYPNKPDVSTRVFENEEPLTTTIPTLTTTTNARGKILTTLEKSFALENKIIQSYPMILGDEYYVLSRNFYEGNDAELTLIEIMTRDYLRGATLNLKQIKHMVELYPKMERLEQFYYGPLLMTLIRYYDQRAYT